MHHCHSLRCGIGVVCSRGHRLASLNAVGVPFRLKWQRDSAWINQLGWKRTCATGCVWIYLYQWLSFSLSESRGTQTCAIWVTAFLSLSSNDWICRKNVRFCRELKGLPKGYYRVGYRILADINVTLQDVLLNSKMTHLVYLRELSRLGG